MSGAAKGPEAYRYYAHPGPGQGRNAAAGSADEGINDTNKRQRTDKNCQKPGGALKGGAEGEAASNMAAAPS